MSQYIDLLKSSSSGSEYDITNRYYYTPPTFDNKAVSIPANEQPIKAEDQVVRMKRVAPDLCAEMDADTYCLLAPVRHHEANKKYTKMLAEQKRERRLWAHNQFRFSEAKCLPPVKALSVELDESYFPSNLLRMASALAIYIGVELVAALLVLLTVFVLALRGRLRISVDELWTEAVEIFAILIRGSGGRKSELRRILITPFLEFEEKLQLSVAENERLVRRNRRLKMAEKVFERGAFRAHFPSDYANLEDQDDPFEDRLERFLAGAEEVTKAIQQKESPEKTAPSLFFGPMTAKKLIRKLNEQGGCLSCIEAEGTLFSSEIMKKHKQFLLSAHDMERISDASLTSGEAIVPYPAISMLFMVQPSEALKLYRDQSAKEVGLSPRFLPFFSSRKYASAGDSSEWLAVYPEFRKMILALLNRYYTQDKDRSIYTLGVDPDALTFIKEEERKRTEQRMSGGRAFMESFDAKAHGHIVRLAAAIHAFKHAYEGVEDSNITLDEMKAASALFSVVENHAKDAFDEHGFRAYQNAIQITKWLLSATQGAEITQFTTRELQQATHICKAEAEAAIRIMEKYDLCRMYIEPTKSTVVFVNRKLYDLQWDQSFRPSSPRYFS